MPTGPPPLARIGLDRSMPRLLGGPLFLILAGATAIVVGLLGAGAGAIAIVLVVLGGVVALSGLVMAFVLLSVRLDVEDSLIRVHWLGGERRYPLARGAVTRVTVRGPQASSLRPSFGALGWALGRARLRGDETIDVVRMAATRTVILVPTEHRRLAIAPRSEGELLEALSDAAQARQRFDEAARAAPPRPAEAAELQVDEGVESEPAHELTGIERAVLEERLAAERTAIDGLSAAEPAAPEENGAAPARPAAGPPDVAPEPQPVPRTAMRPGWVSPRLPPALGASLAFIVLPLIAAGAIWGVGGALDRLPPDGTDQLRVVILALALGGPGTAVGALMARIWWPRLIGVVVTSGLAALVVAARALLGG